MKDLGITQRCGYNGQGQLHFCPDDAVMLQSSQWLLIAVTVGASLALAPPLPGQATGFIWKTGLGGRYSDFYEIPKFAPGQIVSLFVHGIKRDFKAPVVAKRDPVPTSLDGISVAVGHPRGPLPAPVLGLNKGPACNSNIIPEEYCGYIIAVTVQIPYELFIPSPSAFPDQSLTIFDNGAHVAAIMFTPVRASLHIVTSADSIAVLTPQLQASWLYPIVRHPDGSLVSPTRPAKPGEILSVWMTGLGWQSPYEAPPGYGPTTGAPAAQSFELFKGWVGIDYQWGYDVPPRMVTLDREGRGNTEGLEWVGILQGQVGLYQVNFRVPETLPADLASCSGLIGNLTVSIGTRMRPRPIEDTFDGVSVCVESPRNSGGQ